MLEAFENHIKTEFPNLKEHAFLLACSGGVDSMVLLDLCFRLKLNFSVAHCNFKLRGTESDEDASFVEEHCNELNVKNYTTDFNTVDYVDANKVSIQMAAREMRYTWFKELLAKHKYNCVVTAHQANDQLETFLINLSRGTGIDGLAGIPPKTATISRPLLPFSRAQILAYAHTKKLRWREDSSNTEVKYLRNKIRHKIVPLLKELHPSFLDNFQNTQSYLSETSTISKNHIDAVRNRLFTTENDTTLISTKELLALKPLKGYLYALFKPYHFNAWKDILNLLAGMRGKEVVSKTHRLLKDRDHLLLQKLAPEVSKTFKIQRSDTELKEPIGIKIRAVDTVAETGKHILYVDQKTLKYPLVVRKWKKGDYFYPFGMQGKKKLSKFFKDEKMSVIAKENQWLLVSDNTIVWVIGKRADDRFRITETTKDTIKFTIEK